VVVVDYDMANLGSISGALDYLGCSYKISRDPQVISKGDAYILPGVGAFPNAMQNLARYSLLDSILHELIINKKYCLGICLGMQILARSSKEFVETEGLGVFDAFVEELDNNIVNVPHVGWNKVDYADGCSLFSGIDKGGWFYFDHSYYVSPVRSDQTVATTNYGHKISVGIQKDTIFGVQFHPEKSQRNGLKLLRNFISLS